MSSSPVRTPRRAPPPPSATPPSLFGLEKVIPPGHSSRETMPSRPYSRSAGPSLFDLDKPLPIPHRRRSSSVYSGDSGYTKIVASYEDRDEDLPPLPPLPPPEVVHPKPYRGDTVSAFLNHRFTPAQSPEAVPAIPVHHQASRHSRSMPSLRLGPKKSPALSAVDSSHAPSFAEFARNITSRRNEATSEISRLSEDYERSSFHSVQPPSPLFSRSSTATSVYGDHRPVSSPLRARIGETGDGELVPAPLDLVRTSKYLELVKLPVGLIPIAEAQRRAGAARIAYLAEHPRENDSSLAKDRQSVKSFSSDSLVVYTGIRESLKAMIKESIRKRREDRQAEKRRTSRERVVSLPENQGRRNNEKPDHAGTERKHSWTSSRRSSIKEGVSSLMKALSIRSSGEVAARGRTRERGPPHRQLAFPVTPYQKYGAEVWFAKNKKKRANAKCNANGAPRAPTKKAGTRSEPRRAALNILDRSSSREVKEALHNGRSQLLHVLDGPRELLTRTTPYRRRSQLKHSNSRGPADRKPHMKHAGD